MNQALDVTDATLASEKIAEAAALMRDDPIREQSVLRFGSAGQLVMTGDLHGNTRNFDKLQRFCALDRSPGRIVVLHELIHEEPTPDKKHDMSIDLLVRAAIWKSDFPDNVFSLQSNHELSQWKRHEITKAGRSVIHEFELGCKERFGREADKVIEATIDYISALPLAGITAKGVFLAHSLPDPLAIDQFDFSVFSREPTEADWLPGGPGYQLVWGRFQPAEVVDFFARKVGATVCVVGHTPQEFGSSRTGNLIILASDHNHGVFLPIDLATEPDAAEMIENVRKFVAIE